MNIKTDEACNILNNSFGKYLCTFAVDAAAVTALIIKVSESKTRPAIVNEFHMLRSEGLPGRRV
jgi:hypothetical protein